MGFSLVFCLFFFSNKFVNKRFEAEILHLKHIKSSL